MKSLGKILIILGLCALAIGTTRADSSTTAAEVNKPPRFNVLFISVDDLRNDVNTFGSEHAVAPNVDRLAANSRSFTHHYTQVPTCGASRFCLLSGRRPSESTETGNNAISRTAKRWADQSLPATFRQNGYRTLALGKISHHPGGLTGKNWATPPEELPGAWDKAWVPEGPWAHPQAMMHGYANGTPRTRKESPPFEAFDGPDEAYPDALVARDAIATLEELRTSEQPWFFAVGFFKPHLPFAAPKKYFDLHAKQASSLPAELSSKPTWPSGWHASGELSGGYKHPNGKHPNHDPEYAQKLRQGYAAAVSYFDAQLGKLLDALEAKQMADNTVIILWSDHGFLLGEHAIWGKHCLFEQALLCPLIIRYPGMPEPGSPSAAIVETTDIFPTLTDLCGISTPQNLDGVSLRPHLLDPNTPTTKPAIGYWRNRRTIRNDHWRLIINNKGDQPELFDYRTDPHETTNHASIQPAQTQQLHTLLNQLAPPLD